MTVNMTEKLLTRMSTAGLPRVGEKSGKFKFFQGQGIVREFCKLSGKFEIFEKCRNCQGILKIPDSSPVND